MISEAHEHENESDSGLTLVSVDDAVLTFNITEREEVGGARCPTCTFDPSTNVRGARSSTFILPHSHKGRQYTVYLLLSAE